MEKLYSSKNMFENGWCVGVHPPWIRPCPHALITMSLTTTLTNRFGFRMMPGKFCQSCFEIAVRTALAEFGHFTLQFKIKGLVSKGGGRPPNPPGCVTGVACRTRILACIMFFVISGSFGLA